MRLVDQFQIGPFYTEYHRTLVREDLLSALQQFLEDNVLPHADAYVVRASGSLKPEVDDDYFCAPTSLVRDIFILEMSLFTEHGESTLHTNLVYDQHKRSFTPRPGERGRCVLLTPVRQAALEAAKVAFDTNVRRLEEVLRQGPPYVMQCPWCGTSVLTEEIGPYLIVKCPETGCFKYVRENGRWVSRRYYC